MNQIKIRPELMVIDVLQESFDIHEIGNRRFMYCPQTGRLILGFESCGKDMSLSHAKEHMLSNVEEPFDAFVRGWIGTNKREYKDGVIHFAPSVLSTSPLFDLAFCAIEVFRLNGARGKTVIRGLGNCWEQNFEEVFTNGQM